jgi:probable HAF family extracellular repeat protein
VFGGYLRDRRGRTTTFDVPGAASTLPMDLNDHGQIVGIQQIDAQGTSRGFLRDARGRYVTIQVPGAVTTQAFGINNQGLVVGDYYRADGVQHGFVWRRGRFTTIDGPRGTGATLTDLDDRGRVIGVSSGDPANPGTAAGFQLQGRRYTTVAVPGAPLTFPLAVNNRGQIVGFSALRFALEEDSDTHGFLLRSGAGGAFTRIDVPGAFGSGATGINDHGTIVGLYGNPDAAHRPQRAGMPSMPTAR